MLAAYKTGDLILNAEASHANTMATVQMRFAVGQHNGHINVNTPIDMELATNYQE